MSQEKFYEETTKVAAEIAEVAPGGPDVKAAIEVAEETADDLVDGIIKVRGRHGGSPLREGADVYDAIDALTKENAELSLAFYGFVSLFSTYISSGLSFDPETCAAEYERLANDAGEQLASVNGEPPHPNSHLQFLANMMRQDSKPAPLTAIDGSKEATGPRAA